MFEKILALIQQVIDGHFVPKARAEQAEAKLAEVSEQLEVLKAQNSVCFGERDAAIAEAQKNAASASEATKERDSLKSEVETLKANAKTVDEAAAAKAREICAAQGIPAAQVPASSATGAMSESQELDKLRAELATETNPIKKAKLAERCRELRGHSDLFSQPTKA